MAQFAKIHNELYLVYDNGKQVGELDRENGDWEIIYQGNHIGNMKFVNLIDAKKSIENMILRDIKE